MIRLSCLLLGAALLQAPAAAQYIGGSPPEPPPVPVAGMNESPEAALARNVRLLAINPRDHNALLGAGRSALRLGDAQAAIGFFGRAEELNPGHWAPKAGQGSALAQMGEGAAALDMFEQSQRLGATQTLVALDRGLAFDLLGRQTDAQSDYRAVLSGADQAEARRRLALSLAISGQKPEALTTLDPLLVSRDAGARRARAFILALGGDMDGARQAIALLMPGAAGGFDPFLRRLATLGPGQKAAAVHLGMMPAEGAALAEVERPIPSPPVRIAAATPPQPVAQPSEDRLAAIESTLLKLPEMVVAPPPAPKPVVEVSAPRRSPAPERRLANRPASDEPAAKPAARKPADEKKPVKLASRDDAAAKADKGARKKDDNEKPAASGVSRTYVQIAGGTNTDRMNAEYKRLRSGRTALFKGRQPVVSEVRGWARLLVGPFKVASQAQEFVNELKASGISAFVWSAPPGTKFEKLSTT